MKAKINNYLAVYKRKLFGDFRMSMGKLEEYVQSHSSVPEDVPKDIFYVPYSQIAYSEACYFSNKWWLQVPDLIDNYLKPQ